jgi:hypothetical protein
VYGTENVRCLFSGFDVTAKEWLVIARRLRPCFAEKRFSKDGLQEPPPNRDEIAVLGQVEVQSVVIAGSVHGRVVPEFVASHAAGGTMVSEQDEPMRDRIKR